MFKNKESLDIFEFEVGNEDMKIVKANLHKT